jgi:hypothetical protein
MSLSIRENILANLKTTLEGITAAAGYTHTMAGVSRWSSKSNETRQTPCIVINSGPEEKLQQPNPQATCRLTVYLDVWMRSPDTDTTASDTYLSSLLADVEKAVMADHTRGGYAENTAVVSAVPFETVDGQPVFGIVVEVLITYKHSITNPYSVV